ncbi:MAG: hypothetical protein GX282_03935, partial [Campylobacteraceae bacterium]|nr:hypothetical protein [Campylobacteraceae bacterium]
GDDIYLFNKGDGADTIYDESGNDTIRFGEGITKEDVIFTRANNNLSIKYGDDSISISNHFYSNSAIEKIYLSDESFITRDQINKVIQDLNSYANDNAINLNNPDNFKNNPDIMQIYANGWGK